MCVLLSLTAIEKHCTARVVEFRHNNLYSLQSKQTPKDEMTSQLTVNKLTCCRWWYYEMHRHTRKTTLTLFPSN